MPLFRVWTSFFLLTCTFRKMWYNGNGFSRERSLSVKTVLLFTDGACSGNPGPGGWGAILRYGTAEKELSGGEANTTNNRMEISAVINGLSALKEPCRVTIQSDSRYVVDAIEKGWARSWKQNGWRTGRRKAHFQHCIDRWDK